MNAEIYFYLHTNIVQNRTIRMHRALKELAVRSWVLARYGFGTYILSPTQNDCLTSRIFFAKK